MAHLEKSMLENVPVDTAGEMKKLIKKIVSIKTSSNLLFF